jgi:hypothetical protein
MFSVVSDYYMVAVQSLAAVGCFVDCLMVSSDCTGCCALHGPKSKLNAMEQAARTTRKVLLLILRKMLSGSEILQKEHFPIADCIVIKCSRTRL